MVELVTRNYWWPGITRDIGRYVEGCNLCQSFITKLLVVAGKDAILVVCDRLSKMMHFVATTEGTLVEGLVRLFRNNI